MNIQFIIKITISFSFLLLIQGCRLFPPPPNIGRAVNPKCFHTGKLSIKQRLKLYPFSEAASVKVISYCRNIMFGREKTPVKHDTLVYADITDDLTLDKNQIKELTDILYNYKGGEGGAHGCYIPRHSIIFLDKSDKVIGFIEICFQCEGTRTKFPKRIENIDFCTNKYTLLKTFFQKIGIKHFEGFGPDFELPPFPDDKN